MEKERIETLKDMLESAPEDSFLIFALAKEYEKLGELETAEAQYCTLREKDPEYVGLYYHLAMLYEVLDHPQKALSTYHEGIEIARKLKDFHALSELNTAKMNLEMDLED